MKKHLFLQAMSKFLFGVAAAALLIFAPAGTLSFPGGRLFMGVVFLPILLTGILLMCKAPDLLEKRLKSKESAREQTHIVKLSGLMFLIGFVLAGLNHRFGWHPLPVWVSYAASILFLVGYLLYALVLRENKYLSRTVEVQEGQQVIDTGLYAVVRHPMYSATLLLFLSMPLILGSLLAFAVFLIYPLLIAGRIRHEEAFLEAKLEGYSEYKKRVKYRLIPFVW